MPQIPNVSPDITDVQAYLDFCQDYSAKLISTAFFQGQTQQIAESHVGVRGRLTLTELILGTLGRRWSEDFKPNPNTIVFKPRHLDVKPATFEYRFVPQRFVSSYLAQYRKPSFQNGEREPIPFQEFVMMKVMEKQANEIEKALWQGVAAAAPADGDSLSQLFDGFLEITNKAIIAGDITPYATPGGAWSTANLIEGMEDMWDLLDPAYQDRAVSVFVGPKLFKMYQVAYRNRFNSNNPTVGDNRIQLDFCDATLVKINAMGNSNRIIMTQNENLHIGFDDLDVNSFNFERDHRAFDYWQDFQFGVQIALLQDGVFVTNDLA